jgi:hypothetical protein
VIINGSDVSELLFTVMMDTVDAALVGFDENIVCCSEDSARDVITVEDEIDDVSSNNSAVV